MKIIRKRELVIERERSVTIKFGNSSSEKFCAACQARTRFISVDEAAVVKGATARQIFRLIEADRLHFDETTDGLLTICSASLSEVTDENLLSPSPNVEGDVSNDEN